MQLQLTETIERELKEVIHHAINSDQVDSAELRMVILTPDSSFEKLKIYIQNDWETYFDEYSVTMIAEIDISEWLSLADTALENQMKISSSYIERANEYQSKYKVVPPSLNFGHLHILEDAYQAYLICLREELLFQIESAIRVVAVSFTSEDFNYVVGFATYKLRYNLENDFTILGFNHPMGAGPFYKARLSLPNYQVSRPYLKLYESGFQLFLPDEALYDDSEKNSEVVALDISEIKYAWIEDDEIKIRLEDEFENWELSAEGNDIKKGESSNEEAFAAFKNFLYQYPEKILDINEIPDPLSDAKGFQKWLDVVLENNLRILYKNQETIFAYGEDAFRQYLNLLPKTVKQYQQAEDFLASKLFYLGRFQEYYDLLSKSKNKTTSDSIQLLVSLFLLNRRESYGAYLSTIEDDKQQITLDLLNALWLLRENHSFDHLEQLETEFISLLTEYKNSKVQRLLSVVLTKLYVLLNKPDKALLYLQNVPAFETFEQMILKVELADTPYIMEAYDFLLNEEKMKTEAMASMKKNALVVTQNEKTRREKVSYEHCYYLTDKIPLNDFNYQWFCPINADTFIAIRKENEYVIILAKLTAEKTLDILQSIQLLGNPKVSSCVYSNGILYIPDVEAGIITYSVTLNAIEERNIIYKNKTVKPQYRSLGVKDGYLYASNNGYLEVFELNNPEVCISKTLYIDSGYNLFINENLLVVGAGAGLVILVDISDHIKPVMLSTIVEDKTPGNMHVEFIGDYMVSQSVFDISDPSDPKWICYVGEDLAPTYYFATKPEVSIISTGEEFLLTTLNFDKGHPSYINWRESLNADNLFYERVVNNLATAYCGDKLITYSEYEITFWDKGRAPSVEKIDIHAEVETLVKNCFHYLTENYPTFSIGKVHLHYVPLYGQIEIAFHECSSLAVIVDTAKPHVLPVVLSSLNLYSYSSEKLEREFNSLTMQFVYDGDAIIQELIHKPLFTKMSARHVLAIADNEATYLYNSTKDWKPFRSQHKAKSQESFEQIILSHNENLIKKLKEKIAEDTTSLNELLEILNKKIFDSSNYSVPTNKLTPGDMNTGLNPMNLEPTPSYIQQPNYTPEITADSKEDIKAPDGYYENSQETYELKTTAFEILCSHPDRKLIRNILFNGMKFGYLHYSLKDLPADYSIDQLLTGKILNNTYGLWDEFGKDADIRNFLMSNFKIFDDSLQVKIAYHCGHLSHPVLLEYLRYNIAEGFYFDSYKGYNNGIDCSTLPEEVLKSLEQELLKKLSEIESSTSLHKIDEAQQIVVIYAMLYKLGYERMPDLIQERITMALKERERYDDMFSEFDDGYEDENVFLISLYREQKVKRLIHYFTMDQGPLWPLHEAPEPYKMSWRNTIEALWEKGVKELGPDFITRYVLRLSENIALDSAYEQDRKLAQEVIDYSYHHIQNKPELASQVEPLLLAMLHNKEKFKETTDITALKDKAKYTLLQSAWNDIKDKNWDVAEQKGVAILMIDPDFAQVYFLQARLLWLREGVEAYLENRESYIDKAAHDIITLARLYNLTGCALDVERRYEEALNYFKKAALNAPRDPIYVANVAETYYKLSKPKEALKHALAARANGFDSDILKEIIEKKGLIDFPKE